MISNNDASGETILIFSQEDDSSTSDVIKWLIHYKAPFIRINYPIDYIEINKLEVQNGKVACNFKVAEKNIDLSQVRSIWNRRGRINIRFDDDLSFSDKEIKKYIKNHLYIEKQVLSEFFHWLLEKKPHINSFQNTEVNKLHVLFTASSVGLKIPETFITSSSKASIDFAKLHDGLISKPISNALSFTKSSFAKLISQMYMLKTSEVHMADIENESSFAPTLFQEKIEKSIELRIFFLENNFYSMAIFSQRNEKTRIDFRNYDMEYPNRYVPYKLPIEVEDKLNDLMRKLKINSGSIDMILNKNGDYVFLEINPVGQFGMTSYPCQYNLERMIASYLIKQTIDVAYD